MSDVNDQNNERTTESTSEASPGSSTATPAKSGFSVASSPFNAIKLEIAIIIIIAFLLWAVLNSITDNDLTHVAILFLYSMTGAVWVVARIRFITLQNTKK